MGDATTFQISGTMRKYKQTLRLRVRTLFHGSFQVLELVLGAMFAFVGYFSSSIEGFGWIAFQYFIFFTDAQITLPGATSVGARFV